MDQPERYWKRFGYLRIRCLDASDYGQYVRQWAHYMLASARAFAEIRSDPLDNLGTLGRELVIA